jgi:hypothetical protein
VSRCKQRLYIGNASKGRCPEHLQAIRVSIGSKSSLAFDCHSYRHGFRFNPPNSRSVPDHITPSEARASTKGYHRDGREYAQTSSHKFHYALVHRRNTKAFKRGDGGRAEVQRGATAGYQYHRPSAIFHLSSLPQTNWLLAYQRSLVPLVLPSSVQTEPSRYYIAIPFKDTLSSIEDRISSA